MHLGWLLLFGGTLTISVTLMFGGGMVAQLQRRGDGWALAGFGLSLGWFVAIWAASLLEAGLQLTGNHPPFLPLAVPFFLLPWLLLPAGLILSIQRSKC